MTIQQKLIVAVLALSGATAGATPSVYVVTGSGQFGTVNLSTGGFQSIGPGLLGGVSGLVRGQNGSLFALTNGGNLESINPANGASSIVGPTGLGNCTLPTDPCGPNSASTIGQLGGSLYATDLAGNLYSVNPTTGAATLIGPTGLPPLPFTLQSTNPDGTVNIYDQTLFSSAGKLYATYDASTIDFSTFTVTTVLPDNLYSIDPSTGVATLIAPVVQAISSVVTVNGTTYAFQASTGQLLSLDLTNGSTSYVADVDFNAGLINGASPVPEPSSFALLGSGMAVVIASVRKRILGGSRSA